MGKKTRSRYHGSFPAIIRDIHDPMMSGRVKVECPALYGTGKRSPWCLPKHQSNLWSVPLEGSTVWVTLRHGDPRYPLWEGAYTTYAEKASPAEFRALAEGPYASQTRDAVDHTSAYDVSDHKKGHDHGAGEYWNPYWHGLRFPMGSGLSANEEPGEQGLKVTDRIGQYLEFRGDPVSPVDPHDETRIGGSFDAPDLDDGSTLFSDEGYKARTTLRGRHNQKIEFTVETADQEEAMTLESFDLARTDGSHLTFSNSLLDKGFHLQRKSGGNTQGYQARIDPQDLVSMHWQAMKDNHGQEFRINSDPDTPNRWMHLDNGFGSQFKIAWDERFMLWKDHNGQQIRYSTDETIPNRYIQLSNTPGESLRIEHDGKKIVLTDRLGNEVLMDADADKITLTHNTGEIVDLSASGVTVTTVAGMTVNGKNVALHDDKVSTPAGPGNVIASGK